MTRLVGRIAAVAVLVALAVAPTAAASAAGSGAHAAAPLVRLVSQPAWVDSGQPFTVEVAVTEPPAGAQLEMLVHDRLQSRREFRTTLAGELGGTEHSVGPQPLATLTPGAAGTYTIGFTPGGPGTGLSGGGVYPVEVRLLAADGSRMAGLTTYLSYLKPRNDPPLHVGVIVDIGAPPSLQPEGNVVLPPGATERARERAQVLTGTSGVPLTLAPLPETLEALADSGPEGAGIVEQIRQGTAGRRVLARTFVDVDLEALQDAGLIGEANYQADGGADVVRTRLGLEPAAGMWLSGPTLGAEAADLAVDLGFDRAVVPPSATAVGAADDASDEVSTVPTAPVRLGAGGPLTMVSDPLMTSHLLSQDGIVAAHRFVAELAITWLERPADERAVLVHLPPDVPLDTRVVATALGSLAGSGAAQVVPVEHLFRDVAPVPGPEGTIEPAAHEVDDRLGPIAGSLTAARQQVSGVGSALDEPETGTSLDHSLLVSTGTDTPDDARRAYIARVQAAAGSLADVVTLPDEFRITLTTRSSTIPITLTNLSEDELTVRVVLDADQLEFPEGEEFTEVLPPGTRRVEVPVRTRTSGAFTLQVTVTSPDGALVLDTSSFDVRSTTISGVGLVLSAGAGLFLMLWWARHWRKARRARTLAPAAAGPPVGSAGTAVDPRQQPAPAGPAPPGPAAGDRPGDEGPYRPAHMARQRTRSG